MGSITTPIFIVTDDDTNWVVEVKIGKEVSSADVKGNREAARGWANHVSADEQMAVLWRCLLLSDTDVKDSKRSWAVLKGLGD